MPSFLHQVAAYYSGKQRLEDYCFVFPNRRSGQFFEQELASQFATPRIMPRVLTIAEWVEQMSDRVTASTIDMVFLLYQAYCEATGSTDTSFDRFIYWAHIILSDFNDVDLALADPNVLYSNLRDLRQIATDYIDADLKLAISRIFNIQFTESEGFWKHPLPSPDADPSSPVMKYHSLWDSLAAIYTRFHELLASRGLATTGWLYRDAARRLKSMQPHELGCERLVMVGFAALTVSEDSIFKSLHDLGVADFWWDVAAPAFDLEANAGGKLVRMFSKRYPSPVPLEPVESTGQHIHAMAVPSTVGEAKWAFHLVQQMGLPADERDPGIQKLELPKVNLDNAINTAIVLPDESLFEPLLSSVPEGMSAPNVTLGYPMRHAGIVSLMHIVARAHRQATRSGERWMFYREDVLDILSHPIIKSAFTSDVIEIVQKIDNCSDFNVSEGTFAGTALEPLFITMHDISGNGKPDLLAYIDRLATFVADLDSRVRDAAIAADDDEDSDGTAERLLPLQSAFLVHYADALSDLRQAIDESDYVLNEGTSVFHLVDRVTASLSVPFTGEPLAGLQLMGMLETRCLDFDNLIVLSMNERIFPSRRPMSSFIPDYLRAAHFMPTNAWHEAVMTYHFYRLLGRASHVMLVYNASTQSGMSAEPSRYIEQLKRVYNLPVTLTMVEARVETVPELHIAVPKTSGVLDHYTPQGDKPLSASAIKKYLKCPLMFYLRYVQHLRDDNGTSDFMDPRTFGTVIHNTLQTLYYPDGQKSTDPYRVTTEMIEGFEKNDLAKTIRREVNRSYFYRSGNELDLPLIGDALILQDTIEAYVKGVLEYDRNLIKKDGPIEVLECEVPHDIELDLDGLKVNFQFIIDRLDRVGNTVRLIDYKTGTDDTNFSKVDELVGPNYRKHAMMQLLLYCNALYQLNPEYDVIQPMIYKLRKMDESGMMKDKKQYEFKPEDDTNRDFVKALRAKLDEMFSSAPFYQAESNSPCRLCHYTEFCRR